MNSINIPVSAGELIDKWTILEIKSLRITEKEKLSNIMNEFTQLEELVDKIILKAEVDLKLNMIQFTDLIIDLKDVNENLWDIEDEIRELEHANIPGIILSNWREGEGMEQCARFVELSRAVYITNDKRSLIKKKINELLGSELMEEKSYKEY